jgi:serine O-acetyltransferase
MKVLRQDVHRTYELLEGGRLRKFVGCARAAGVHAVVIYRFGQSVARLPLLLRVLLEPLYFVLNLYLKTMWGIELPRAAQIGPGLYIGHFGGITVSPQAVLGRYCTISQNITIGVSGAAERRGVPVIGDNVFIAPGARLFGKIRIGNDVKIGANAVIYKDIPDKAIVVLDPGFKIISYDGNSPID